MPVRKPSPQPAPLKEPAATSSVWNHARRPLKIAEKLARQIVDDIVARDLCPGSMLPPEAEMIRDYDVSRGTLREALRLLEMQGLIAVKPGPRGGPRIVEPDSAFFATMLKFHLRMRGASYRDVLSARLAIEPLMARLAAEAQDKAGMAALRHALAQCEQADPHDEAAWLRTSHLFHATVAGISGNSVLNLLGMSLKDIYHVWAQTSLTPLRMRAKVLAVHRAIADAILGGDGAEAERLMRDHMLFYARQSSKIYAANLDDRIDWG